jgi:hypothetical protein
LRVSRPRPNIMFKGKLFNVNVQIRTNLGINYVIKGLVIQKPGPYPYQRLCHPERSEGSSPPRNSRYAPFAIQQQKILRCAQDDKGKYARNYIGHKKNVQMLIKTSAHPHICTFAHLKLYFFVFT